MNALPPAWVLPQAKFDLDFANQRYWNGAVCAAAFGNSVTSLIAGGTSTSNVAYAPDRTGLLIAFNSYVPRITSGMGLWAEQYRVCYNLYSRDLTNAIWTATGLTAVKNQTGADGATNTAVQLTASAANATIMQALSVASQAFVGTAYLKRLSGGGAVKLTIDGGATWTDVTAQLNSTGYTQAAVPTQTLANPSVGLQLASAGDSIAVDFVNCCNGTVPLTPLLTTSATTTFFNDEPTFNTTGGTNLNDGQRLIRTAIATGKPASFFAAYCGNPNAVTGSSHLLSSDGGITIHGGVQDGAAYQGVTTANTGSYGVGALNKLTGRTNGGTQSVCLNGGPLATASGSAIIAANVAFTHCGLGNNGAGNGFSPLNGYIARMTFWDQELSDGQMIEYTR